MDNNLNPQPVPTGTPAQPNVPIASATTPTGNNKSSNKLWIIFVIIGVLVAAAIAGYLYIGNLANLVNLGGSQSDTATIDVSDIQKDLDSVSVEDIESEFSDIDKDLQSL